jgi:uncharacterized glyoxalase superfamily protein PhnB
VNPRAIPMLSYEDVDAAAGGAEIIRGLGDAPPGRLYAAEDPAGHRWMFLQPAAAV